MRINPYSEIPHRKISERLKTAKAFGFELVDDFDPEGDLTTPNSPWTMISKAVLNRDGYSCRVCGKSKLAPVDGSGPLRKVRLDVEVHHIIPRKLNGSDSFKNLITLCSECHTKTYKNRYRGLPRKENAITSYSDRILVAVPRSLTSGQWKFKSCRVEEMLRFYDQDAAAYRIIEREGVSAELTAVEINFQEFGALTADLEKEFGAVSYFTMECDCPTRQKLRLTVDRERNIIA